MPDYTITLILQARVALSATLAEAQALADSAPKDALFENLRAKIEAGTVRGTLTWNVATAAADQTKPPLADTALISRPLETFSPDDPRSPAP